MLWFVCQFSSHEFEGNNNDAIFVDSTSGVNLLAGVPVSSLEMVTLMASSVILHAQF